MGPFVGWLKSKDTLSGHTIGREVNLGRFKHLWCILGARLRANDAEED